MLYNDINNKDLKSMHDIEWIDYGAANTADG